MESTVQKRRKYISELYANIKLSNFVFRFGPKCRDRDKSVNGRLDRGSYTKGQKQKNQARGKETTTRKTI